MKKIIFLLLFIVSFHHLTPAEQKPFANLLQLIEKKNGWNANRKENAEAFHRERDRLKEQFKPQLMEFLSDDIDRHYNAAMFLSDPYYLGEKKPENELALLIYQQGISIILSRDDDLFKREEIAFRVLSAVLAYRMNLKHLAVFHKSVAEELGKNEEYRGSFPALDEADYEIYENIKIEKQ